MKLNFKNSKRVGIVIGIILFLSLIAGITYAWLSFTSNSMAISGSSKCFNINYTNGGDVSGNIGSIKESDYLTSSTIRLSKAMAYTSVSLELDSECSPIEAIGTIELNVSSLSNVFTTGASANSLKYVVAEFNSSDYSDIDYDTLKDEEFNYIRRGSISSTGTMDIHSEYLKPGVVHDYLIIVYIDKNMSTSNVVGQSFDANVSARAKQIAIAGVAQPVVNNSNYDQVVANPITDYEYTLFDKSTSGLDKDYVLLTKYIGTSPVVKIPDTYTIDNVEYSVVLCGNFNYPGYSGNGGTFVENTNITEVILPDVYNYSSSSNSLNLSNDSMLDLFSGCSNLTSVLNVPSSVTNMRETFYGCTSLESAPVMPISVTNMQGTFSGCTSLVNAPVIPNSVTNMQSTFRFCTSLVNAPVIPNSVTNMDSTFDGCTSLVNAPVIPDSVTNMQATFYGCTNLVNAPVIPNSVTNMVSTFLSCTSLVNAPVIPNLVTNMQGTFDGCTSLVNAPVIPDSVTNMVSTFRSCTSLVNAPVIPNSVTNMYATFSGCTSLSGTVRIESSIVTANSYPFYGTVNNITVEVPAGSTTYNTINNNKPSNVTLVGF